MLSDSEVKDLLTEHHKQLIAQQDALEKRQHLSGHYSGTPPTFFSCSQAMIKAEIDWIDKII